jgi:hypothetical protein
MRTLNEILDEMSPERREKIMQRYEQLKDEYYATPTQESTKEWSQEDWFEEAEKHEKE